MSQSRRDAFVWGALTASGGVWSEEEAMEAARLAYPIPVGFSTGSYTVDVIVDGSLVRWFIESANPTDVELRDFVAAEIAPHCEAIAFMARQDHKHLEGPWGS